MQTQLQPFYDKFKPLLAGILPDSEIGFQTAYNIFDYLNVGYIHNSTIFANLSSDDLFQLRTLADSQSFDLVYNVSSPNASIGGETLAYLVLNYLNQTVSQSSPSLKVTYFPTAYTVQLAFWGLSNMTAASPNFYGLPDYASAMAFELRRPAGSTGFSDLTVRFGFRNGSDPSSPLIYFPMFGTNETDMSWTQWSANMKNISISSDTTWCTTCNSTLPFCTGFDSLATNTASQASNTNMASASQSCGLSAAAGGGIGAGVTIGVIALVEGAMVLQYQETRWEYGKPTQ
jgi:prostatic aicd phosphatase